MALRALEPEELRWHCDPQSVPEGTEALPEAAVGQSRAHDALELGLAMKSPGFNIFITGLSGSGRMFMVERMLRRLAPRRVPCCDRVFVENFEDPLRPSLLTLPPGVGARLKRSMKDAVEFLQKEIPALFESEAYVADREAIRGRLRKEQHALFRKIDERLAADGLIVVSIGDDEHTVPEVLPQIGAEAVTFEVLKRNEEARAAFEKLEIARLEAKGEKLPEASAERQRVIEARIDELEQRALAYREELARMAESGRRMSKLATNELKELARRSVRKLLTEAEADLTRDFPEEIVQDYVRRAFEHLLQGIESLATGPDSREDPFDAYEINVVHEGREDDDSPIILERHPSYTNLFGTIEHERVNGGFQPGDFSKIQSGSLLRADGGYLILYAKDVLLEPGVWRNLIRTLRFGQLEIQAPESALALVPSALKPEPIPVDVKVILIGDASTYHLLETLEEEFPKIFKVKAEFDSTLHNNPENLSQFLSVIEDIRVREDLLPLTSAARAALAEEAVRRAGRKKRISIRFGEVADLVREADFRASKIGASEIDHVHILEAATGRRRRHDLVDEKMTEQLLDEIVLIATDGERVGQINGLSYFSLGAHAFGKPGRITATVSPGRQGLVNIEREAQLSGPIHNKGVLILGGYFRHRYGREHPLAFTASLAFEQSYGGIDGDSASIAELYALLSVLSDLPIRQTWAVTGSLNQLGDVQAVGGLNEKIEGFHRLCSARGLSGDQGCVLPSANVDHLMLGHEVLDDVRAGRFSVHAISTVDDGIPLLFGVDPDVVHEKVEQRILALGGKGGIEPDVRMVEKLEPYSEEPPQPPEDPMPPHPGRQGS